MSYTSLRREGLEALERMSGERWTDFNAHDPGITLLEQLCYALSDLGYRIDYGIPDLLASGTGRPEEILWPPEEILSCQPVTLIDLRKLVLDVEGVRNAWIEPAAEQEVALYFHLGEDVLSHRARPPISEPVRLRGLYRVLIEVLDVSGLDGSEVRRQVVRRLHAHRNLCEDFVAVQVLEPQPVQVRAEIDLQTGVDDPNDVLLRIFEAVADDISPPLPFTSLDELLRAGQTIDEIFDGPLLEHGFLDTDVLRHATRKESVRTSDLVHAILEVPEARVVKNLQIAAGGPPQEWSLPLDPARAPRLDLEGSEIRLSRGGVEMSVDIEAVRAAFHQRRRDTSAAKSAAIRNALPLPVGRDRSVGRYHSLRYHLPSLYGVGEMGLESTAPAERRARARQLAAYLAYFDQLLASGFAQLEHATELLSAGGDDPRTYFTQEVDSPAPGLDDIYLRQGEARRARLLEMAAEPDSLERKNRLLDHLLARFGESVDNPTASAAELVACKQTFLRRYARVGGARGAAFDTLRPVADAAAGSAPNLSGLEERLRLLLALDSERGETLVLVEHILLRPMAGDEHQQVPLLAASPYPDPYSLQLSLVLPTASPRLESPDFQLFAERTIREQTPAHLIPFVHWLSPERWSSFEQVHQEWLARRREHLRAQLDASPEDET